MGYLEKHITPYLRIIMAQSINSSPWPRLAAGGIRRSELVQTNGLVVPPLHVAGAFATAADAAVDLGLPGPVAQGLGFGELAARCIGGALPELVVAVADVVKVVNL